MAEVDVPICLRGSADAKHHDIRLVEDLYVEISGLEPSIRNVSLDETVQPDFKKRRLRLPDCFHLIDVAVNTIYAVPNFSKASGAHAANVSNSHHDYISFTIHAVRPDFTRRQFIIKLRTAVEQPLRLSLWQGGVSRL